MSGDIDNDIRRVPFAKESYCVVCLKTHPLAAYETLRLEQVRNYQIAFVGSEIAMDQNYGTYSSIIQQLLAKRGIYLRDVIFTQQIDTLGMTLKRTNAISIMPFGMRHMDRNYLKFIPLEDEDCAGIMCLYYRMDNENPYIPGYVQEATGLNMMR